MQARGAHFGGYELLSTIAADATTETWVARAPAAEQGARSLVMLALHRRAGDREATERFLRASRVAASVVHPNVASIREVGERDGVPFVVLEYVDGEPLSVLLATARAPAPAGVARRVIADVCAGLAAAHRVTIHGAVSANAVFLSVRGEVKLVGFASADERLASARADVAGAAAVLSAMFSGAPPPEIAALVQAALAGSIDAARLADALEPGAAHRADVATWVEQRLSEGARERRRELAAAEVVPPRIVSAAAAANAPAEPGFMDVRALMARRPAREHELVPPDDDGGPVQARPFVPAESGAKRPAKRRLLSTRALGIGAGLLLVLFFVAVLAAPAFVKKRAIARAAEAGIVLTIERASIGFGGVSLHGVGARVKSVPELTALRAEEIDVLGLFGREVRVVGLDATIDGPLSAVATELARFAGENEGRIAGTPTSPKRYAVVSGRFTWKDAFGAGTEVQAGAVEMALESRGAGLEQVTATIPRFDVRTPKTTFGPWSLAYERSPQAARARVLFDPPLMDGPSAMLLWENDDAAELTVRIPRSPMANLGIRPGDLDLPADAATELEATIEGTQSGGRRSATAKIDLWAARPKGTKSAVDAHFTAKAAGPANGPLELGDAVLEVAPFVADVKGTVDASERRLRLDATWRTRPIPCADLVRGEAKKLGPIVEALEDLASRTGAARVTGSAYAAGLVRYDTSAPDGGSITWTAKETCGVSIFGL